MQQIPRTGVVHFLKTWPEPFDAISRGEKTYEIREDDRCFRVGDVLVLRRWADRYDGIHLAALVTYKTSGGQWGIPHGLCVLGIQREHAVPCHPSYFTEHTIRDMHAHVMERRRLAGIVE